VGLQQAQRIQNTEILLGQEWLYYYVGYSEDEALVGLAVNQLREMCYSKSKDFLPKDGAFSREGYFDRKGVDFVRDRKTLELCQPKTSLYEQFCG